MADTMYLLKYKKLQTEKEKLKVWEEKDEEKWGNEETEGYAFAPFGTTPHKMVIHCWS